MAPIVVGWILAVGLAMKRPKLGLALSALGGLLISGYLGMQHISHSESSACSVDTQFDCAAVNLSKYGTLAGHIDFLPAFPLSFLGFAFYAGILALAIVSLSDDSTEEKSFSKGSSLVVVLAGISVLLSFYLAYISGMKLGKWCLYCIGMYGFNASILLSGILWSRSVKSTEEFVVGDSSLKVFASIFLTMCIIGFVVNPKGEAKKTVEAKAGSEGAWTISILNKKMDFDGSEPIYGSPSAPYTVVEFADFQCPHCAEATPAIKKVITKYRSIANLKYKHFPLSNQCNHNITSPLAIERSACTGII